MHWKGQIKELSDAIDCCQPVVCNPTANASAPDGDCDLLGQPTKGGGPFYQLWDGPFFTAGSVAEYIELLYMNNMSWTETAAVTEAQMGALMELHTSNFDISGNWAASRVMGSTLMAHLRATVEQLATGAAHPQLLSKASDKLVYYAGHDTNQYFLRQFLRMQWLLPGFNRHQLSTGGMLEFELLSDQADQASGIQFVKVYYVAMTYKQQRGAEALDKDSNPPARAFVTIPECCSGPGASCPLQDFLKLTDQAIDHECVGFPMA